MDIGRGDFDRGATAARPHVATWLWSGGRTSAIAATAVTTHSTATTFAEYYRRSVIKENI